MKKLSAIFAAATLLSTTLTAEAFEELGKVSLEPYDGFVLEAVGTKTHWLRNGEELTYETLKIEDGLVSGIGSDGCKYTLRADVLEPLTTSWADCGGATGSHNSIKMKGKPWPMKVKTKYSFSAKGSNTSGATWKAYKKCKVKSAVKVKVVAGEFDTFKLVCSTEWDTRTVWFAPELGAEVAVKRKHKNDSAKSFMRELVRIETPS